MGGTYPALSLYTGYVPLQVGMVQLAGHTLPPDMLLGSGTVFSGPFEPTLITCLAGWFPPNI